jgi:hypothetical protein
MRIVVNHLTRMRYPRICVAGIDLESGEHVRPVAWPHLPVDLAASHGGPLDIGAIVELGPTQQSGHPPEVEDRRFELRYLRRVESFAPERFWRLLDACALPRLQDIFGPDLTRRGATYATDQGIGAASLGCYSPAEPPHLYVDARSRLRLALFEGDHELHLPVTDLRFVDATFSLDLELVESVQARLKRCVQIILSVGLTRPYTPDDSAPRRHWLQVNNLNLADDPTWGLKPRAALQRWTDDDLPF